MLSILISFGCAAAKFVCYLFLAIGGIVCGKKYRDYKNMKAVNTLTEERK
jgi:hypothetical protein